MAWFYMKSGFGVATVGAGFASQQTGTFAGLGAANVYGNVQDLFSDVATRPGAGDIILCSNLHSGETVGDYTVQGEWDNDNFEATFISVDDSAIDTELAGAVEGGGVSLIQYRGLFAVKSMTFLNTGATQFKMMRASNCVFDSELSGHPWYAQNFEAVGSTFSNQAAVQPPALFKDYYNGSWERFSARLIGCIVSDPYDYLLSIDDSVNSFNFKGTIIDIKGSDLTGISVGLVDLDTPDFESLEGEYFIEIHDCKLNPSLVFWPSVPFYNDQSYILITNSGAVSSSNEYQLYYKGYGGQLNNQDQSGVVRIDSDTERVFHGGETVSYKCETDYQATNQASFSMDIPSRFFELSNPLTGTIRVYFAVVDTVTLTDVNFWVEVIYSDETDKHEPKFISGQALDSLSSGTEHQTDLGSNWQDNGVALAGYNEYYLDIACPAGADGVPTIRINIGEPSVIVYVASQLDGVA